MRLNRPCSHSSRKGQSISDGPRPSATPRRFAYRYLAALLVLTIASLTFGQQTNAPAQSNPAANNPAQSAPSAEENSAGKLIMHDQAEYDAWTAASNTKDPKDRAEAMEAFAQKYPRSVVAKSALEDAMIDWQTAGDSVKVLEVAKELLAQDSGNVRALAIVVALDRVSAAQGDSSALDELCLDSTGGMRIITMWQKPAGMTDADFTLLHKQMDLIFNGAAGYCALQQSNYSQARDWFTRAYQLDSTNLQNIYQLAISDLEMTPLDPNGFWFCARAISLAAKTSLADSAAGMESYCRPRYTQYHGSNDGWEAITSAAATQSALPSEFARKITMAPPPPPSSAVPRK